MSNYHKDYTYWSKSLLSKFLKSPKIAKMHIDSVEKKDSKAMAFGRAYHSYIDGKENEFFVLNECERPDTTKGMTAKVNIEWKNKIFAENETVITVEEFEQIKEMRTELYCNNIMCKLLGSQTNEEVFKAEINGFKVKCKPDRLQKDQALIIDWKTIDEISERKIRYAINDYDYDMQCALYADILEAITVIKHNFIFVFQAKTAPYEVLPVLIRNGSTVMQNGREKYLRACKIAKEAFETNVFKGVSTFYENGIWELI